MAQTLPNKQLDQQQQKLQKLVPSNVLFECLSNDTKTRYMPFDTTLTRPAVGMVPGTLSLKVYIISENEYLAVIKRSAAPLAIFMLNNRRVIDGGYEVFDITIYTCPQSMLDFLNPRTFYYHPLQSCYGIGSSNGMIAYGSIPLISKSAMGIRP